MTLDEAIQHSKEVAKKERDKLLKVGDEYICSECGKEHEQLAKWLEELKEYKQLEEQGLIFKSPYKIGDVIYLCISKRIIELKISCIEFRHDRKPFYRTYKVNTGEVGNSFGVDDMGKIVFLTKEEAEQELKELER